MECNLKFDDKFNSNVHPGTGHEGPEGEQRYNYFPNLGTRSRWVLNGTPRPLYPQERPGTVGWTTGPDWTGAEKLASTGIRSLDHPDRSQSLYRLSHPGPRRQIQYNLKKCYTHHTDLTSETSICINAFCIETLILGQVCGSPFSRFHEVTSEI